MENMRILQAIRIVLDTAQGNQLLHDFGMSREQMENFMFAYYMTRRG